LYWRTAVRPSQKKMTKQLTRKTIRLRNYNYFDNGYYFVTICTYNKRCLFGDIIDGNIKLNDSGQLVDQILRKLPEYYHGISIDNYIVMPNHIHTIIIIKQSVGAAPRGRPLINTELKFNKISNKNRISDSGPAQGPAPTACLPVGKGLSLSDIIYRFKSLTTKRYMDGVKNNNWQPFNKHLWQRSFHDHIIRVDESLNKIREYIRNNPATWDKDEYNEK